MPWFTSRISVGSKGSKVDKDKLLKLLEDDDLGILSVKAKGSAALSADDRLVSSFKEVTDFVKQHGRNPEANKSNMLEFRLHSRLAGLRNNRAKAELLQPYDEFGLLPLTNISQDASAPAPCPEEATSADDQAQRYGEFEVAQDKVYQSLKDIFADDDLGILDDGPESIFRLKNVPTNIEMPEKIAQRKPCKDFANFEHLFKQCHAELAEGIREVRSFTGEQQIKEGHFFVLHGVMVYVAEVGEKETKNGKVNARLRCIFENETESNMLLRSLATELYKDETGRRILDHHDKALEDLELIKEDDKQTGYIYILRSLSKQPEIASIANLYKIGYSTTPVEERVKNAAKEPTYLMAPVKIVTAFQCYNLNPQKLEHLLHTFFGTACLAVEVVDAEGKKSMPREWFIAPLHVIETTVELLINGEIVHYKYDQQTRTITPRK